MRVVFCHRYDDKSFLAGFDGETRFPFGGIIDRIERYGPEESDRVHLEARIVLDSTENLLIVHVNDLAPRGTIVFERLFDHISNSYGPVTCTLFFTTQACETAFFTEDPSGRKVFFWNYLPALFDLLEGQKAVTEDLFLDACEAWRPRSGLLQALSLLAQGYLVTLAAASALTAEAESINTEVEAAIRATGWRGVIEQMPERADTCVLAERFSEVQTKKWWLAPFGSWSFETGSPVKEAVERFSERVQSDWRGPLPEGLQGLLQALTAADHEARIKPAIVANAYLDLCEDAL